MIGRLKSIIDNRKITLGAMTLLLILAIIIVSSFWPFILDPKRIGTAEFWTDELIIIAITIASLISMMFISQASNAQDARSEVAKAKVEFDKSIKRISNHTKFFQWIKKVLQPNDRKDIAEQGMIKLGIDTRVFYLTDTEIRALTVAQKFDGVFYKALTKEEIEKVIELKEQVKKIRFVSPSYYTTYNSIAAHKNLSQIAANESRKKIFTVIFHLTFKIIVSFTIAAIFTSLVIDLASDQSAAQAWMRFLSRLMAFISSAFLGYLTGCKVNDLDAFYILKRVEVHTLYLEDIEFKPVDEGKEEFKKRVLEENQKLIGQDAHLIEEQNRPHKKAEEEQPEEEEPKVIALPFVDKPEETKGE